MIKCNKCNSTDTRVNKNLDIIRYDNADLLVYLDYTICNNCNREFIPIDQILHNDKTIKLAVNLTCR